MLTLLEENQAHLEALLPVILSRQSPGRNDPCPCRSGQKYKRCHANVVEKIVRRIGRDQLAYLYRPLRERAMQSDASTNKERAA